VISKEKTSEVRKNSSYSTRTQPGAEEKERSAPARASENSNLAKLNYSTFSKKEERKTASPDKKKEKISRTFHIRSATWSSGTKQKKVNYSNYSNIIIITKYTTKIIRIIGFLNQDQVAQAHDGTNMNQDDFLNFQIDAFRRKKEEKGRESRDKFKKINQNFSLNAELDAAKDECAKKLGKKFLWRADKCESMKKEMPFSDIIAKVIKDLKNIKRGEMKLQNFPNYMTVDTDTAYNTQKRKHEGNSGLTPSSKMTKSEDCAMSENELSGDANEAHDQSTVLGKKFKLLIFRDTEWERQEWNILVAMMCDENDGNEEEGIPPNELLETTGKITKSTKHRYKAVYNSTFSSIRSGHVSRAEDHIHGLGDASECDREVGHRTCEVEGVSNHHEVRGSTLKRNQQGAIHEGRGTQPDPGPRRGWSWYEGALNRRNLRNVPAEEQAQQVWRRLCPPRGRTGKETQIIRHAEASQNLLYSGGSRCYEETDWDRCVRPQHATAQSQNTRHQRRSGCHRILLQGVPWSSRPPVPPRASQEVPRKQDGQGQGQHDARPEHAQHVGQGSGRQQLQQVIKQNIIIKSSHKWQERKLDILYTQHSYALQRV
jgi:hypothetical protein